VNEAVAVRRHCNGKSVKAHCEQGAMMHTDGFGNSPLLRVFKVLFWTNF
jgi:hypothetical protein